MLTDFFKRVGVGLAERWQDFAVAAFVELLALILIAVAKWALTDAHKDVAITILAVLAMVAPVVYLIVCELRKPRAVVKLGTGKQMPTIIIAPEPAKVAKENFFQDTIVSLKDVAIGDTIVGKTFRNCRIDGPALIDDIMGNKFDECTYAETEQERTYTVPDKRAVGAYHVLDCCFLKCRFFNVARVIHPK